MKNQIRAGALALCVACGTGEDARAIGCDVRQRSITLPPELSESSGLAMSRRTPGVLWTHNDSGDEPVVYAVGAGGELRGAVRVAGAENRDWEDIAVGPCPAGSCLYVADTGDNEAKRDEVHVYRVPEPDPGASVTAESAERLSMRYPGGPRDVEALFVLPSGELFVITKGRRKPVEVFRYPLPVRPGETVELERVATLKSAAQDEVLQVTGADASPDGEWIAVRAYRALMLHRTEELLAGNAVPVYLTDLTPVAEAQGEAVALADDGTVVLSSEGVKEVPATLTLLTCSLPE